MLRLRAATLVACRACSANISGRCRSPWVTLENIDNISSSLDALIPSLDSFATSVTPEIAMFNLWPHELGFFRGPNLEAAMATAASGDRRRALGVRARAPARSHDGRADGRSARSAARESASTPTEVVSTEQQMDLHRQHPAARLDPFCARQAAHPGRHGYGASRPELNPTSRRRGPEDGHARRLAVTALVLSTDEKDQPAQDRHGGQPDPVARPIECRRKRHPCGKCVTTTTVTAQNCGTGSVVLLFAVDGACWQREIGNGTIFVSAVANWLVHAHATPSNTQTDRTFGWVALG